MENPDSIDSRCLTPINFRTTNSVGSWWHFSSDGFLKISWARPQADWIHIGFHITQQGLHDCKTPWQPRQWGHVAANLKVQDVWVYHEPFMAKRATAVRLKGVDGDLNTNNEIQMVWITAKSDYF